MVGVKIKTTIIIPTLNRQEDLQKTLFSISKNTIKPDEILIIEQGDIEKTNLVSKKFRKLKIRVLFFGEKSLTRARNFGIKESRGDIIFMFDDDVYLDSKYLQIAVDFFKKTPGALAITGRQTNFVKRSLFSKLSLSIFNLDSFVKGNHVTLSAHNCPGDYDLVQRNVEWLQGFNMIFRRTAFEYTQFPKEFFRWSFNEDVYATYKLYKQFPEGLYYVPSLKIQHFQSPAARLTNYSLIRMKIVYRFMIWKELCYKPWLVPVFIWSLIGILLIDTIMTRNLRVSYYWLLSMLFIFRNWNTISDSEYNEFIFSN